MIYLLIVLTLILIMPIKVKITRNDNKNDVELILTKIFNISIDIDELIRYLLSSREDNKITLDSILYNVGLFIKMKRIIISLMGMLTISKLTYVAKQNIKDIHYNIYAYVGSWTFINYFRNFIHKRCYVVKNEYYSVRNVKDFRVYDINIECEFNVRLLYVFLAVIINIKDIPKIIKYIKGSRKNELTSNI